METGSKPQRTFTHTLATWLLVFTAGSFVMLMELVGARVLTPYFGNTIYVWGSVIGIFLVALAIGYALGGRMTQRYPSPIVPAAFAVVAGVYVAATVSYQDSLSAWLYYTGMRVKWGALIAAVVLYAPPMALLGGISPYCVHLATKSRSEAGIRSGALYAISTVGSFIGCMVTAFVLIPNLPISQIILCSGVGMTLIALIVALVSANRTVVPASAMAVIALVAAVLLVSRQAGSSWGGEIKAYEYPLHGRVLSQVSSADLGPVLAEAQSRASKEAAKYMPSAQKVLVEAETPYHHLTVVQNGPVRQLISGKAGFRGPQTTMDLRDLSWHVAEYTHMAFAGLVFRPAPRKVCVIGIGGAVIPRALESCVPGVQVDAVDIDPAVVKVAQDYFYWRPSRNVRVYTQDGRSFINWILMNKRPPYDWVILDAYNDDYIPFHLTTKEFFEAVKRALAPDGIVAANICIDDDLYGCEARTFKEVFGNVTPFAGHRSGNVILVAQNGRTKPLTLAEAAAAARKLRLPPLSGIDLRFIVSCLMTGQNWSSHGPVLTDLWSPVETLID
ncbi:MAG TPA: fused MFS/spermidine synthase [Armatimonadota bacterium]|nr:fused MFS/spermidine synthase [Armatimonadota bacterium]